jgi:sodium-dependent dicarboxylate transporter 2/3/5
MSQTPDVTESPQSRSLFATLGLFAGPLAAALLWFFLRGEEWAEGRREMAGAAAWIVIWWLTEAIPLAATALLPLVLFPLLKVVPAQKVAVHYGDSQIFLFLGGFLIALGVEQSGLHRRIALAIIATVGESPRRIVLGFVMATGMISMWMSNTATALMMMPMASSVMLRADRSGMSAKHRRHLGLALMLGVGYAASMGGIATLIGTPPNVAFKQLYEQSFPTGPEISFGGWMLLNMPMSFALLFFCWVGLVYVLFPLPATTASADGDSIAEERRRLGPMSQAEWRMLLIFLITATLWIFREPVDGWGWAPYFGLDKPAGGKGPAHVDDATVAIAMALICFLLPERGWSGKKLIDWDTATRVPWGILILFGGGLALANGLSATHLDALLGHWLGGLLAGHSDTAVVAATTVSMTALTEVASNLSSVQISMPLLAEAAQNVPCDPRMLMIPATLAASCGFMLPVGTAANAIAFSTGRIRMPEMLRAGLLMDALSIVLIVAFVRLFGQLTLGITSGGLPDWANQP